MSPAARACTGRVSHPPQGAFAEPRQEARPALRMPVQSVLDRDLAEAYGFRHRPGVASLLDRIVVEGSDLVRVHALGRKPGGDMDVAELGDVGEHLVGAGAGNRAGVRKGVADQDDAGLAMTG